MKGMYRIVHRDANENTIAELLEKHSSEYGDADAVETDPQKMVKVKKGLSTIMREDDILAIQHMPDATITEAATGNAHTLILRIPVTFRNTRTRVVYEKTLVLKDFIRRNASAVSKVWTAGEWYDIAFYKVPAQSELKHGHSIQDVRVDSAENIYFTVV